MNDSKHELAEMFTNLAVRFASQRAWSCSSSFELPPEQWIGILSSDASEAKAAFKDLLADRDATLKAMMVQQSEGFQDHPGRKAAKLTLLCA